MTKSKLVVAVIPAFNGGDDIKKCLASLSSADASLQIIVVDNNSSDGTVAWIKENYPSVNVIALKENTGYVGGCLRGYREAVKAGAAYVTLINQDLVVEKNWLAPLVMYLEQQVDVAVVQPLVLTLPDRSVINSAGNSIHFLGFGFADLLGEQRAHNKFTSDVAVPREISYATGAAPLLRVKHIDEIGLYPTDFFMYHEDLDLGWRVRMFGKKSVMVPSSKVYHRYEFHRSTAIKYEYGERNRQLVLLYNYQISTLLLLFPAWFIMEIGTLAFSFVNGWWKLKLKGYKYIIAMWPDIMAERRKRQKERLVNDRQVTTLFVGDILYQEAPTPILRIVNPVLRTYWAIAKRFLW